MVLLLASEHAEPLDTPASDDLELLALAAPRLLLRPGESERLTSTRSTIVRSDNVELRY